MTTFCKRSLPQRRLNDVVLVALTLICVLVPGELLWAETFDVGCDVDALISAINAANANGVADVINLAPGCTYTLNAVDNETDCYNGLPSIISPITINGNGATIVRSSAATDFRIFHVAASGTLMLRNLILSGGVEDCSDFGFNVGGGIVNFGTLTLEGCTVSDNSAGIGGGIANAGDATLINCTVSNNSAASGGGIDNHVLGTLQLINSTVSDNDAFDGGGIYNDGTATLVNSTISGNSGSLWGGGLLNEGKATLARCVVENNTSEFGGGFINAGELSLTGCTTYGNSAVEDTVVGGGVGGGIYNYGPAQLTNCTISDNSATNVAGGIYNDDEVSLNNVTIAGNTAGTDGGGIYVDTSDGVELKNTLIADNTATTGPDCAGTLTSFGHNLIGDNDGCTFTPTTGDLVGTSTDPIDPLLDPLQNNGGPTETHSLLSGSPAIDAGSCSDLNGDPITADQRGYPRPSPLGGNCDIGAYEAEQAYVRGDLNGDSAIDLLDVILCTQLAHGHITGSATQRAAADVDSDGDVDADDVTILSEYVLGIRKTLP
ncbi:choice-of-anchor Q domain-containing protein [Candidatus Bipolaricaulota bacterium]